MAEPTTAITDFLMAGVAFVLASIAVAALGAVVQATRFTLHPRFNFNDLYHVIQIVSLILLYRGARASEPARPQPSRRSYSFLTIR